MHQRVLFSLREHQPIPPVGPAPVESRWRSKRWQLNLCKYYIDSYSLYGYIHFLDILTIWIYSLYGYNIIYIYIYILYLEPKLPLFWLERTFFWMQNKGQMGSSDIYIYTSQMLRTPIWLSCFFLLCHEELYCEKWKTCFTPNYGWRSCPLFLEELRKSSDRTIPMDIISSCSREMWKLPSLKLTFSHLKMNGWKTFSFPFGSLPICSKGINELAIQNNLKLEPIMVHLNVQFIQKKRCSIVFNLNVWIHYIHSLQTNSKRPWK